MKNVYKKQNKTKKQKNVYELIPATKTKIDQYVH